MLAFVRSSLNEWRGHWPRIARETGLSYHWMQSVAQGRIRNPGVQSLEVLDAWFRSHAATAPVSEAA